MKQGCDVYRVFVGDVAKVNLFKKALGSSELLVGSRIIEGHNGTSYAEITFATEEFRQKFLNVFYQTKLFEPWSDKLARMN